MNAQNRPKVKQLYGFGTLGKIFKEDLEKYKKELIKK